MKKKGDRWQKAEAKFFGFDHGGIGGALLRAWNLPKISQEAVTHNNFPTSAQSFPLEAAIVHLADIISHQILAEPEIAGYKYSIEKGAWDAIQLFEDLHLEQIIDQVDSQLEDVSKIFIKTT